MEGERSITIFTKCKGHTPQGVYRKVVMRGPFHPFDDLRTGLTHPASLWQTNNCKLHDAFKYSQSGKK